MESSALLDIDRAKYTFLCGLYSHGSIIIISTNSMTLYSFLEKDPFVRHHIPDVIFLEEVKLDNIIKNSFPRYTIIFEESDDPPDAEFDSVNNNLYVRGLPGRDFEVLTFVFTAVYFFSKLHQEKRLFGIHCGGVALNKEAIVILGGSAAGKSSIAGVLCSSYGADYLCDERALFRLNNNEIDWIGGNNILTFRKGALKYLDTDQKLALYKEFIDVTGKSTVEHKLSFEPLKVYSHPLPVRYVVSVRLTNECSVFKKSYVESTIYEIFANLSQDIHGLWGPFLKAGFALCSLDTDEIRKNRLSLAMAFNSNTISIWDGEGNLDYICRMIVEMCQ